MFAKSYAAYYKMFVTSELCFYLFKMLILLQFF